MHDVSLFVDARDFSLFGDAHVRKYEETSGQVGHDWNGTSCLVLRTKGRKSGKLYKAPLIYGRDGEDYVLVASNGGAPDDPGWYKNLLVHPEVEIQVHGEIIPVTAHPGAPEDKRRVWPIMVATWADFDEYQARTERDIPVVLLKSRSTVSE